MIPMDLWKIGFALLIIGIAIPIGYGLYQFVLTSIEWYWRISILFIIAGIVTLLASAVQDKLRSTPPEEKY
ncbi:hypothetical protein AKJ40_03025 [candidate division MSBL1 archaeon SCGC-AAA259M10]|uniref:Uncharacterized protein n=1 Tax=candidate division MSBL1 archaeon SCGC-AAA259M10 TaxID=1698270 RepID=A0A133UZ86_9EURY|nr:hypothetical protein AKJ40_03025 [candidate division MSBL1 archaeon SCGC-AAA259M10]